LLDYKTKRKTGFPIKLAFDFYLKFEKIHPFENGN
jgi:Fic family protein